MRFLSKGLLVMLLACSVSITKINARDCEEQCNMNCYECGCNPLYCGAFDLQFQGGIAPILWRNRDEFTNVNCEGFENPLVSLVQIPKFRTFFKLPWTVGGQVGYAWSDNTRVYLEFNYLQANSKNNPSIVTTNPLFVEPETLIFTLSKYKLFDAYVGARYYWDRWCDRVSFFLGAKVGLTHHKRVNFALGITTPSAPTVVVVIPAGTSLFNRNTVVSGGGNFGLDICFCGNWSLVITGEVVASCGPNGNPNVVLVPTQGTTATNFLVGHIGTELRFPVTAAIRYSF